MSYPEKMLSARDSNEKKLLVLDASYSLEDITKRGILSSVLCRDLDGYFKHVWTVHPFATIVTSPEWAPKFGKPIWHSLAPAHTFVEGKIGRYKWLKWFSPLNFFIGQFGLFISLRKLIKKENIRVIRVGDMLYLGLFGLLLSRVCKIPFVVRVGGNYDKIFEATGQPLQKRFFITRSIEKRVERFVLKRAHLVAGANQDNLDFALNSGARKEFSTIFRYGNLLYEGHFTDPRERAEGQTLLDELGIKVNSFLLYVGRLEKVKHPDHVIQALAAVRQNGHNVKALLVGGGTMTDELKEMAITLGIQDYVVLAGNKDQEWLSRVIPLASIVLSPHTGRALSETALGAASVVAYDIDWQAEIIENNVTGLLVTYPDQSLFNEAVERLLTDTAATKRMGNALREKAIKMLDPKKLNEHEIKEYEALNDRFFKNKIA
jgi:glycosyltransferase involved in cell wall biosynthesis